MNSQRSLICISFFLLCGIVLQAQSPYYLPGSRGHEINERWDVLYWKQRGQNFSSVGNVSRKELVRTGLFDVFAERNSSSQLKSSSTARDSTKAALEAIYDGNYEVRGSIKQGIFRLGSSSMSDYSDLDWKDSRYIINDNIEYEFTEGFKDFVSPSTVKKYDDSGMFYYLEDESKKNGIKFRGRYEIASLVDPGWDLFGTFYKTKANFYHVDKKGFKLVVNPILNLVYGSAKDDPNTIFKNIRGVELRGRIDKNFYFYTNIVESQARFNNFMERRISKFRAIPGQGAYKIYNSGVIESLTGWDFLNSQAYVGANLSTSISAEFGHGKHFIGNGIRSLILSDYANNYFYLKFNTKVWKFQLQNLFAELAPISDRFIEGNNLLPKKYMANHYLTYSPRKNMEIGLFETVVFSREDQFELQYLNPIILYRTVEQFLDSPDNVLIGLTGKWNILNGVQLYGQLILDEFKLGELTAGDGWWANKYGLQTGVKYYNVASIDHLDVQLEYNTVRPYTYAHRDTLNGFPNQNIASYTHFNQPLAHPLGSNFKEFLFEVRYRPLHNLFIKARIVRSLYGQNPDGQNFGGNPLLPLESREADYGNFTGQGIETNINILSLDISYEFYHNYHIDLRYLNRNEDASRDDLDINTNYLGLGLRVNLAMINLDY